MKEVIEFCPYKIHRILTDNGAHFTYALLAKHLRPKSFHPFDLLCKKHAIKDATTKTYHYDSLEHLEKHPNQFMLAYNFAKKLKALAFKTPFELLIQKFKKNSKVFHQNLVHYSRGLNS